MKHFITKKLLLGIPIKYQSKKIILEEIKKFLISPKGLCHIVSLNPENLVVAHKDRFFKKSILMARISIVDGVGVDMAARVSGIPVAERITGVDLMSDLMDLAEKMRLRVLLIGGKHKVALKLVDCYSKYYTHAKFFGLEGFNNIRNPQKSEQDKINSIVRSYKPHMIFVAFGSPWQEKWIERHDDIFDKTVCMGVGQGFDVAAGKVHRAPGWVRSIGFEWFYRLLTQPWRWKRQLRLIEFVRLLLKEKLKTM